MPHCSNYVWQYGVQHHGVDGRPGEYCSWQSVMACLVSVQERLRGWRCGSFFPGRRPHADSRVRLTKDRKVHSSGCGIISSLRVPTVSRMTLQCPRWWHSGGDGRTGLEVMGETRSAGLMSRRRPAWVRDRRSYPFRGFRRPLSRVQRAGRSGVDGTVSRS
jgi:hypothetical protein